MHHAFSEADVQRILEAQRTALQDELRTFLRQERLRHTVRPLWVVGLVAAGVGVGLYLWTGHERRARMLRQIRRWSQEFVDELLRVEATADGAQEEVPRSHAYEDWLRVAVTGFLLRKLIQWLQAESVDGTPR